MQHFYFAASLLKYLYTLLNYPCCAVHVKIKDGNQSLLCILHNTTLTTCTVSATDRRPAEEINILIFQPDSKNSLHSHSTVDK